MGKKVLLTAIFAAGAFAASQAGQLNARNTTIAEEYIAAGGITPNLANAYQVSGPVAETTKIILTLNAGKFAATKVNICKGSVSIGSGSVDSTTKAKVTINLTSPLATGTVYTFKDSSGCGTNNYIKYSLSGLTAGQTVTLTVGSDTNDPNVAASAVVATIKRQFSAEIKPVESKIDLANLKSFVSDDSKVPGTSASLTIAGFRIVSDNTIQSSSRLTVTNGSTCKGTLNTNTPSSFQAEASFTIKGTLTEYRTLSLTSANGTQITGTTTYSITAADRTNQKATLTVDPSSAPIICEGAPSNVYNGIALKVDGNNNINIQDLKTSISIKINSNTYDLVTDEVSHKIRLDATRAYIPLLGKGDNRETYIKIQSNFANISNAPITATVVLSDGTTHNINLGTMTAGQVKTITATEIYNAVVAAGKTVDPYSFAAVLNIPAPEDSVYIYANIVDPSGAKRVPVKIHNGKIVE